MEEIMFLLTLIGTIATVISTVISIRAKNEARRILEEIKQDGNRNVQNLGNIKVDNTGSNQGSITGINTGSIDINAEEEN